MAPANLAGVAAAVPVPVPAPDKLVPIDAPLPSLTKAPRPAQPTTPKEAALSPATISAFEVPAQTPVAEAIAAGVAAAPARMVAATPALPAPASAAVETERQHPQQPVPQGNPVLAFAARVTSDARPESGQSPALEFSMETEAPQTAAAVAQRQEREPAPKPATAEQPPAVATGPAAAFPARPSITTEPKGGEARTSAPPTDTPDPRPVDEPGAAQPVREVSIRIVNEKSQSADVRMTERNGEIQVAVRASDSTVANSLRNDVNDLVRGLASTGAGVEILHAGSPAQANTGGESGRQSPQNGSQNQQQNGQDGASYGNPQQRHGEGGRRQQPWLDDFESISGASQVRRNGR